MHIARWRLVLVASSLVALGALGGGLVQANRTSPAASTGDGSAAQQTAADLSAAGFSAGWFASAKAEALADLAARPAVARRIWRHLDRLVHAEATVDLPRRGITTYTADGGTLESVGGGTLAVSEKTGTTVTVQTNADTKVRKDGKRVGTAELAAGDRVVVISEKRGADVVALWVLVRPKDG